MGLCPAGRIGGPWIGEAGVIVGMDVIWYSIVPLPEGAAISIKGRARARNQRALS